MDEMDKFLQTYDLKTKSEESENLNKQIIPNEIEAVIKLPTNKALNQLASQVNFTKHSEN